MTEPLLRHRQRTMLCQILAYHFETLHELANAGQFDGQGDHHTPKPYVRQVFRKCLECRIFAHGSTRARWCASGLAVTRRSQATAFATYLAYKRTE